MSYEQHEVSQEQGAPVTLFRFVYGAGPTDFFAYTNFDAPVTYDSVEYIPTVIAREDIDERGSLDATDLTIHISPRAELVGHLDTRSLTQKISVLLLEGHFDDTDMEFVPVWSGELVGKERKDLYVDLICESIVSAMRRLGLRRSYQRSCTYALYGHECRAGRTVRFHGPPIFVGGNLLSVGQGWNGEVSASKFVGGYVLWVDPETNSVHTRTIVDANSAGVLNLDGVTEGLSETVDVTVFVGCNHLIEDCRDLHNNINNYGGQWRIPLENPVGYTNRFY